MAYFSNQFKKQKAPDGKIQYWFQTCYTQDDSNYDEKPPLSVDGEIIRNANQLSNVKIPEETYNPIVCKQVFEKWIEDCSGSFVKSPTVEQCLANMESVYDSNAPTAGINTTEENTLWTLQWIPTRIKVDLPHFQIYWAPCYKIQTTRIVESSEEDKIDFENSDDFELQTPEKPYIVQDNTRLITAKDDWMQELNDSSLPLSDSPALRLVMDIEETQREKYRRRVREARIRAKLARYRAERLAQKYEDRFGVYPEEDLEEAQTEAEQSDEE